MRCIVLVWLPIYCLCVFTPFLLCSPAFPIYQSFRRLMSQIDRWYAVHVCVCAHVCVWERDWERNCVFACLQRCPLVRLETGWCLNCPICTSLWPRRQVFLAWTLPLYTNMHTHVWDKRGDNLSSFNKMLNSHTSMCVCVCSCMLFFR